MREAAAPPPMPWDEARWPWGWVVVLVAVDWTGLLISRHVLDCRWGWYASPPSTPAWIAVIGNWSLLVRMLIALQFMHLARAAGSPWSSLGWRRDALEARLRRFGAAMSRLIPAVFVLAIACVVIARVAGHPEWIQPWVPPGEDTQAWALIFIVALPPVEETIYRGIVHPMMRRHMGVAGAILMGGLLFGAVHSLYGIPLQFVWGYAIAGMMLAWVYERTGSLFCSWLVHLAANLLGLWLSRYPALFEGLRTA